MIPKKIHILTINLAILDADTSFTRAWVSLNPHEDRTEYTNLSQAWHEAKEEPKKGEWILGEYQGDIYQTYLCGCIDCAWSSYVKAFSLIRWAYIKDLMPKGGRKCAYHRG